MMMFRDLAINLAASLIYDFSKGISAKSETVQTILKKLGASSSLHDFPNRYVEALVELRFAGKERVVLEFFREESIMEVFYDYYYGSPDVRVNDHAHAARIAHCVEALRVGDAVKAASVDVAAEVQHFWEVFRQKVQESRTVKEVEVEQELRRLRSTTDNVQEMMSKFLAWMEKQGKETIELKGQTHDIRNAAVMPVLQQFAEKVFNISSIGTAHFYISGDRKIPHALTANPFHPEVFLGREADLQAIHDQLFSGDNLLLLVNGVGGVGKTSIASRYYHLYQDKYAHVAWVLSEKSIAQALLLLSVPLGLQFPDQMNTEERLDALLLELASLNRPCLLVVDNANELPDLKANYQRLRRCSNFHLLLTTRITAFAHAAAYPIEGLPEAEALLLFKKYYPRFQPEKEEAIFKDIRAAVGGNTLVVELLAKNLALFNRLKTNYTLADLLADLRQKGLLGLAQSQEVHTDYQSKAGAMRKEKPEAIIAAMYDLGDLPAEETALLSVFAVLPAESIPFETLETLLPGIENLEENLFSLSQKGWIEYNEAEAAFKCSPVVQEIVRRKNPGLRGDCQVLVDALNKKLEYEGGTGHLINATYAEALHFARYAESVFLNLPEPGTDLSILAERIGRFHQTTGNLEQAFYYFEASIQINKALCASEPDNADFKNGLAISCQNLGNIHSTLGNLEQALIFFEQYNLLEKELYEAYPQNVLFKNNLAISYSKLGQTQSELGNLEQALTFFEDETKLFEELYEAYPQNVSFKYGLQISYEKRGDTHTSQGNLIEAMSYYEKENQLIKELHDAFPQNASFKNGLAISYEKLGQTQSSLGNLEQALTYFEKEIELTKELYEAYPQNVSFKNGLAVSYSKLGDTQSELGNLEQALTYFEERSRLGKELYEAYPQNVSFKNGLAISYYKLGQLYEKQGNLQKAFEYFEQDLKFTELTFQSSPSNAQYRKNLRISYDKMGKISEKLGKKELAEVYFEKAKSLE